MTRNTTLLVLFCLMLITKVFAQKGADLINIHGQVLTASRAGSVEKVRTLLSEGGSPDVRDRNGNSALNLAAARGDEAMADLLLAARADVQVPNLSGVTPLMSAAYAGRPALVQKLLAAGARIEPVDRVKKNAAIYAAAQGCTACLGALASAGQPLDVALDGGLTLLMWAAGYGHEDTVQWLLARGVDPSRRDGRGKRAVDIAADAGFLGVVKRLEMGAH